MTSDNETERELPKVGDFVRIIGRGEGVALIAWKPGGFPKTDRGPEGGLTNDQPPVPHGCT